MTIRSTLLATLALSLLIPAVISAQEKSKSEPKAKGATYPLYGKVVSITSRTLTIVRSNNEDAQQSKYTVNSATEYVNGDKPATAADVVPGKWVGGVLKKAEGDGNDVVVKINVGVKQREEDGKTGASKKTGPKKAEPKKSAPGKEGQTQKEAAKKKES